MATSAGLWDCGRSVGHGHHRHAQLAASRDRVCERVPTLRGAGVLGGVVGVALIAALLATWLVLRRRRIRAHGASSGDEESPYAKAVPFASGKGFHNGGGAPSSPARTEFPPSPLSAHRNFSSLAGLSRGQRCLCLEQPDSLHHTSSSHPFPVNTGDQAEQAPNASVCPQARG